MQRPGYVQGGQRGYLLLGVYHRRIPGSTRTLVSFLHEAAQNFEVFTNIQDPK
jgi:hypothetical protein